MNWLQQSKHITISLEIMDLFIYHGYKVDNNSLSNLYLNKELSKGIKKIFTKFSVNIDFGDNVKYDNLNEEIKEHVCDKYRD
jgi:hypothetical protein